MTQTLNLLLIEADNKRSLGGSCWRDMVNLYQYAITWANSTNTIVKKCFVATIDDVPLEKRRKFDRSVKFDRLRNHLKIFDTFVKDMGPTDLVLVLISGHGYQRQSQTNETDGLDEYISSDSGEIVDNVIYNRLIKPLAGVARVVCLGDTCHSGTLFDNTARDANVYSLSACLDKEFDTCDISQSVGYGGALTVHLLDQPAAIHTLIMGNQIQIKALATKLHNILRALRQTPLLIMPSPKLSYGFDIKS